MDDIVLLSYAFLIKQIAKSVGQPDLDMEPEVTDAADVTDPADDDGDNGRDDVEDDCGDDGGDVSGNVGVEGVEGAGPGASASDVSLGSSSSWTSDDRRPPPPRTPRPLLSYSQVSDP